MAGLIGLTASDIDLQDALKAPRWAYEGDWIPHPVVRLTTTLPIAVNRPEGRTIVRARWGFPVGDGRPVGNARDDKLLASRLWGSMLAKTPCLVATTGVYEQIERGGEKVNFWFRRRDRRPIVMPGLSGARKVKDDERLCAAIVTTDPSRFFSQYHMRQVCVLSEKEADRWLEETDAEQATKLLHSPADDEWEAVPVDGRIFKPGRVETEHLVEIGTPERWTGVAPKGEAKAGKKGGTSLDQWS